MATNLNRRAALAGLLATAVAIPALAVLDPTSPPLTQKEREALWADLAGDELTASRALLKLAARPREAVELCKEKLRPLTIDAKRVRALLADLGSKDDATWKAAVEELGWFDPRLAIELPTLMDEVTERVPRARLVALLSGDREAGQLLAKDLPLKLNAHNGKDGETYYNFFQEGSWWAEHRIERLNEGPWGSRRRYWTRAVRAIVLLEHLGTSPAVAIIKDLATGHPDAQPTRAAKEAVGRMEKKR
jgi:hypothetical protein